MKQDTLFSQGLKRFCLTFLVHTASVIKGCLQGEGRDSRFKSKKIFSGGAGYRSRYLSHAKRALYHLSYAP